jgi:glycerol-3-phosphate acyltransferase PlsY
MHPALFSFLMLPLLVAGVVTAFLIMEDGPEALQYGSVLSLAYLIGSIPWGYYLLRWRCGVDVRKYGSGRTGMSNVLRTAGGKVAALVLFLDLGKGVLAVLLARVVIGSTTAEVTAGLLTLLGHNWPVFLQFRGGRGIATGLGGLMIMAPIPAAIGAVMFLFITLATRYLSLGSIIGVVVACLSLVIMSLMGIYASTYWVYALLGGSIIIWQHRDNIRRMLRGDELRLGHPAGKVE